ncbi:MAG: RNA polymerase factor sigma-32 [Polyangia bacterium]
MVKKAAPPVPADPGDDDEQTEVGGPPTLGVGADGEHDGDDDDVAGPEGDVEDVGPVDDHELERIARTAPAAHADSEDADEDDEAAEDDAEEAREDTDEHALVEKRERSIGARDPLALYIKEIKQYPLLSREDEHALAASYVKDGDLGAARRLVTANLRLVVKIAHEYRRAHRNILDLIQEGNVGLMQAVKKYDPYRGVKLSSYAAWWIRAYILKFILANWRLVKIGTTQAQRKLFFNLKKERDKLEALGVDASSESLAKALNVSEREVIDMEKRLSGGDMSLDAPASRDEDDGRSKMETMEGSLPQPDAAVEGAEFRGLLRDKLGAFAGTLEGRERTIFEERLLNDQPKTLQEIGDKYDISRERARQLEKRLLDRLKVYLRAELGDAVEIALGPEG